VTSLDTSERSAQGTRERLDPVVVARDVLARLDVCAPREIRVDLIAYHLGAITHWRDAGSADARVVRAGERARLAIAKHARGTPRARFSIAHELGHVLLHHDYDSIERIHGAPRLRGRDFVVENEASKFAAHLLVPTSMAHAMCVASPPTLDEVGKLARAFDVSLSVAAQRWAEMSPAACAFVESKGTRIARVVRSRAFRGVAVQRRELEDSALAREVARGAALGSRADGAAWGATRDRPVIEECVPLHDDGGVLTWLWHE
jgi:hypothetical protein